MVVCPSCAHENRDRAKFCEACASPLGASSRALGEERKVVTSLFCDLVGFTAISESADPEDVDRMLATYFAMARKEIESHGGVVEKFIGDAVVGVFGVPAAHEDDPERAVRAGLRITEAAGSLSSIGDAPLKLRVGINTGEALVRLAVAPGSGEGFLTGDSVNTAARIQSVAPEMGVAVGPATYEATQRLFDYRELEMATLKGKSVPVRVFHAKAPRARLGIDLTRTHDSPFIGREIDLSILKGVFDKTVAARTTQLVTVVGEPGLGKSRIVAELGDYVDAVADLVTWRQGRCLPYGEGITFWALGEILKAHTGILESDDAATAEAKLELVLPEGPEREWFHQRLLPLLGIDATSGAEREELFTAWRRFLEHVAEISPTVLVFEDLHWADPAMLGFLEHLADRAEGVPLLIVGTARPELFELHPGYARSIRNATPINLTPLSHEETARLVSALLDSAVTPAELQGPILERSGGNPLYAEEFVRLLKDRELLVRSGSSWVLEEGAEIPFPDSVQSLIAARLDTLPPERKAMLADAAVIGKVFWAGAVATMGGIPEEDVVEGMRELSRKELVRPARHSSMEDETEYAFWHVLARDVAYAQLPRASRASRHVAAAAWIESKASGRLEDLADVLAYHYALALELARAAGQTEQAGAVEGPALRFLTLAGERALDLDNVAALAALERALALSPEGHPQRPEVLARFGEAAFEAQRFSDSVQALEEAIDLFRKKGESLSAARAMNELRSALQWMNDPRRYQVDADAIALLETLPPGREIIETLSQLAATATVAHARPQDGVVLAERAIGIASDLGLPIPPHALLNRGNARCTLGDMGGVQDAREALRLAIESGQSRDAAAIYNDFGILVRSIEGPRAGLDALDEGIAFAQARGLTASAQWMRTTALPARLGAGELADVLEEAATLGPDAEAAGDAFDLMEIRQVQSLALVYRGQGSAAAPFLDRVIEAARRAGRADFIIGGLGAAAVVETAIGHAEAAAGLMAEIESTPGLSGPTELAVYLPGIVRAAIQVGEADLAGRLLRHLPSHYPEAEHAAVAVRAALAEARGETEVAADAYADAAERLEGFGLVIEQGFALLGRGRCLIERARSDDAAEVLRHARAIFAPREMRPAREETDALLAKTSALSG
jgi:class 3 adenylate cyclase/tetratricopeptide (TPR) repeat protein